MPSYVDANVGVRRCPGNRKGGSDRSPRMTTATRDHVTRRLDAVVRVMPLQLSDTWRQAQSVRNPDVKNPERRKSGSAVLHTKIPVYLLSHRHPTNNNPNKHYYVELNILDIESSPVS
uniref:Uncharacterized protein n=1 Tax=Timema genevievae TaxID=629358 RepID=A0A7R9JSR4_TIMGE|nr:unnamed protein product [Timema genevievae]